MSPRRTEKTKLTATYLNGLAIAVFAVGGLAPLFAGNRPAPHDAGAFLAFAAVTLGCWAGRAGLHFLARAVLSRLLDDEP